MLDPALRTTFEACLDALRGGDRAALEACLERDAETFDPLEGGVRAGAASLKGRLPDLELVPLRTYGEGPELAARVRLSGGGRETEGVLAFRFNPEGRVTRLILFFDPSRLLSVNGWSLERRRAAQVIDYFRTYNADEEDAHMALLSPSVVYFGAVSRMTAQGIETARGVFRSAHARMGLKRFDPVRVLHAGPHAAVFVRIHGSGPGGPMEEGLWIFRFDGEDRFERVSVLWNPGSFLSWPPRHEG